MVMATAAAAMMALRSAAAAPASLFAIGTTAAAAAPRTSSVAMAATTSRAIRHGCAALATARAAAVPMPRVARMFANERSSGWRPSPETTPIDAAKRPAAMLEASA